MIKVGTVCVIVRAVLARYQGAICTVVGIPFDFGDGLGPRYPVDMADGSRDWDGDYWYAKPNQLQPIAPPGLTERESKREPATLRNLAPDADLSNVAHIGIGE